MTTLRFIATSNDAQLQAAAVAANRHFAKVGISAETAKAFRETASEAGLAIAKTSEPGTFAISWR
jgi:hypothetical protein